MTMPTLDTVLDGIEGVLDGAVGLHQSQTYDQLTEGIPETPLLQVYPDEGQPIDPLTYNQQRGEEITVLADLYARQRSNMRDDMKAIVDMGQAMLEVIRTEHAAKTNFGVSGIHHWSWSWRRALFEYGETATRYAGIRFTFKVSIHP